MAEEEQNNSKMAGDGLKKGNHSTIVLMIRYKICTYLCMSMIKVHNICIFCFARAKSQLQVRRNCPNSFRPKLADCFQYNYTLVVYFQTEVFSVHLLYIFRQKCFQYTCMFSDGSVFSRIVFRRTVHLYFIFRWNY